MKKVLFFAIILGGTIAFTSCSKDEECVLPDGTVYDTTANPVLSESQQCDLAGGTMQ